MKTVIVWFSIFFVYFLIGAEAKASSSHLNRSSYQHDCAVRANCGSSSLEVAALPTGSEPVFPHAVFLAPGWMQIPIQSPEEIYAEVSTLNFRTRYLFLKTGLSPPVLS